MLKGETSLFFVITCKLLFGLYPLILFEWQVICKFFHTFQNYL